MSSLSKERIEFLQSYCGLSDDGEPFHKEYLDIIAALAELLHLREER